MCVNWFFSTALPKPRLAYRTLTALSLAPAALFHRAADRFAPLVSRREPNYSKPFLPLASSFKTVLQNPFAHCPPVPLSLAKCTARVRFASLASASTIPEMRQALLDKRFHAFLLILGGEGAIEQSALVLNAFR